MIIKFYEPWVKQPPKRKTKLGFVAFNPQTNTFAYGKKAVEVLGERKERKKAAPKGKSQTEKPKVEAKKPKKEPVKNDTYYKKIKDVTDNLLNYSHEQIEGVIEDFVKNSTIQEIRDVGEKLDGPVAPRTKAMMLKAWKWWAQSIKLGADKGTFHVSGANREAESKEPAKIKPVDKEPVESELVKKEPAKKAVWTGPKEHIAVDVTDEVKTGPSGKKYRMTPDGVGVPAEEVEEKKPEPETSHMKAFRDVVGSDYASRYGSTFDKFFKEFDSLPEKQKSLEYRSAEKRGRSFQSEIGTKVAYAGIMAGLTEDGMRSVLRALKNNESSQPADQAQSSKPEPKPEPASKPKRPTASEKARQDQQNKYDIWKAYQSLSGLRQYEDGVVDVPRLHYQMSAETGNKMPVADFHKTLKSLFDSKDVRMIALNEPRSRSKEELDLSLKLKDDYGDPVYYSFIQWDDKKPKPTKPEPVEQPAMKSDSQPLKSETPALDKAVEAEVKKVMPWVDNILAGKGASDLGESTLKHIMRKSVKVIAEINRRAGGSGKGTKAKMIDELKGIFSGNKTEGPKPEQNQKPVTESKQQDTVVPVKSEQGKKPTPEKPTLKKNNWEEKTSNWNDQALSFIKNHGASGDGASIPELYQKVIKPKGITIGQFHDGLRNLADEGKIELVAYTKPGYTLEDEQYALVDNQEIKYYAKIGNGVTKKPTVEKVKPNQNANWNDKALSFIGNWRQSNSSSQVPLPELYENVVKPMGVTVGQFHDGLRSLASKGKIRLFGYTRPPYTMEKEQYALVDGQEIKYYAQPGENFEDTTNDEPEMVQDVKSEQPAIKSDSPPLKSETPALDKAVESEVEKVMPWVDNILAGKGASDLGESTLKHIMRKSVKVIAEINRRAGGSGKGTKAKMLEELKGIFSGKKSQSQF